MTELTNEEFLKIEGIVRESQPGLLTRWFVYTQTPVWSSLRFRPGSDDEEVALFASREHIQNAYHALQAAGYRVRLDHQPGDRADCLVLEGISDADCAGGEYEWDWGLIG